MRAARRQGPVREIAARRDQGTDRHRRPVTEAPAAPDITLTTTDCDADTCAARIEEVLDRRRHHLMDRSAVPSLTRARCRQRRPLRRELTEQKSGFVDDLAAVAAEATSRRLNSVRGVRHQHSGALLRHLRREGRLFGGAIDLLRCFRLAERPCQRRSPGRTRSIRISCWSRQSHRRTAAIEDIRA